MAIGRSISKGSFIDAFLVKMRENPNHFVRKQVYPRKNAHIFPGWLDGYIRIVNGKLCASPKFGPNGEFGRTWDFTKKKAVAEKNVKRGKKK